MHPVPLRAVPVLSPQPRAFPTRSWVGELTPGLPPLLCSRGREHRARPGSARPQQRAASQGPLPLPFVSGARGAAPGADKGGGEEGGSQTLSHIGGTGNDARGRCLLLKPL